VAIVVVIVALAAPVWLDPVTLDEFRGATPFPMPSQPVEPEPTVGGSPDVEEVFTVASTVARDDFRRQDPAGWGVADKGGAYTVLGDGALVSTRGGVGVAAVTGAGPGAAVLRSVRAREVEVVFDVSGDALTRRGVFVDAILRLLPDGSSYRTGITVGRDGGASATIRKGTGPELNEVEPLAPSVVMDGLVAQPDVTLRVRAQAVGSDPTTIRMRAWPTYSPEPQLWQVSVIDWTGSLQHDGAIGIAWGSDVPFPNSAPVLRFDDLVARANAEVSAR
jgi:hypothetical protein